MVLRPRQIASADVPFLARRYMRTMLGDQERTKRMTSTLWPHQETMIQRATAQPGTMWDADMGTGKSRAAIVAWERMGRPKTIIVAPLSVVRGVWPDEFERWAIHPMPKIGIIDSRIGAGRGKSAVQNRIEVARTSDVAIINYDLIWRKPLSEAILKMGFELLIMDESHRIKAAGGVTSRYMSRLSDRIPKRVALTGTPMPHSPMDIYAQYRALDKRIFGTSNALFKARYGILGGFSGREVVGYQREDELRQRFASIAVSVNADDVLTLPDSVDSTRMFELSPKALKLYKQAETQFLIELEQGIVTIANALVKLLRLQQITSGYLKPEGSSVAAIVDDGKQSVLEDILTDSGESHTVVFCRFIHDLNSIRDVAGRTRHKAWEISGRLKELEAWRVEGGVLAVQIQSGGLGIDLTAARTGIYYSLGFSLGDYLQSRARILRPGQKSRVHYIHIVGRNTVDEKVLKALERRQQVIETIIYEGKK